MAAKKKTPTPGNHITKDTETLVARIPKNVKRAYEQEAVTGGVGVADLVREDLALGLKRRGYVLTPETRAASGL